MFGLFRSALFAALCVTLLTACVSLPDVFEKPEVTVTSFTPIASDSLTPRFKIVLHVTNPNREPLGLEGMSYNIHLEGNKVMSGVANDLPTIEPYGEADVTLDARVNLLSGFNLLTGMMNQYKENIAYEFNAKLDAGTFIPTIHVNKKGELSLSAPSR